MGVDSAARIALKVQIDQAGEDGVVIPLFRQSKWQADLVWVGSQLIQLIRNYKFCQPKCQGVLDITFYGGSNGGSSRACRHRSAMYPLSLA